MQCTICSLSDFLWEPLVSTWHGVVIQIILESPVQRLQVTPFCRIILQRSQCVLEDGQLLHQQRISPHPAFPIPSAEMRPVEPQKGKHADDVEKLFCKVCGGSRNHSSKNGPKAFYSDSATVNGYQAPVSTQGDFPPCPKPLQADGAEGSFKMSFQLFVH